MGNTMPEDEKPCIAWVAKACASFAARRHGKKCVVPAKLRGVETVKNA
jgi:hypothetical protein